MKIMLFARAKSYRLKLAVVAAVALAIPVWLLAQHGSKMDEYGRSSDLQEQKQIELSASVHKTLGCSECHGHESREMGFGKLDPVTTCADCHERAFDAWRTSVHADAFRSGVPQAASCVACHGSHGALAVDEPRSPVSRMSVTEATCARCHESPAWTETHPVPPNVVADYRGSFHGLSAALGDQRVANCASCHSYHEVLLSSDPSSTTSERNLAQTCAACHAGANAADPTAGVPRFATGGVHRNPEITGFKIVGLVSAMYVMMITLTIGFMLTHNAIDLYGRVRRRLALRRKNPEKADPGVRDSPQRVPAEAVVTIPVETPPVAQEGAAAGASIRSTFARFTLNERIQHWALAASFITLAVTGFALVFSWQFPLLEAQQGVLLRGWLHRAAALVFAVLSIYHAGYMMLTRRGRMNLRALLPRIRSLKDFLCGCAACFRLGPPSRADWRDLIQMARYNLGFAPEPPAMGRFNYTEKLEYFGLVWGSSVMIATGLILWFEVPVLKSFPYWTVELATAVHYYEAILAALSLVVWHFYFTIYNPDVFPLSKTMITGEIDREDMERDHAFELRTLKEEADRERTS